MAHPATDLFSLDLREIPPGQRHPMIFGQLGALPLGDALHLLNDHDPAPLRRQLDSRWPGEFECALLEAGPTRWQLQIRRVAAAVEQAAAGGGSCCSGGACCG